MTLEQYEINITLSDCLLFLLRDLMSEEITANKLNYKRIKKIDQYIKALKKLQKDLNE